ncbi:hypothetical protein [Alteromonas sp. 14N.309.X.WAT.G.H12]|uniref:hypothetical protein n=1 Tax=Alteromonas sp. 14N.309.X.WAT.G.H12 TaxID=3120824 RepID=UPI003A5986CE
MLISFVDTKAAQLCFFLRGFWQESVPYSELDIFFWDTLEEWSQINYTFDQPYTSKERVFWHVLHQLHYWSEGKLKHDPSLITELTTCLTFLEGGGVYPSDCVGIRP